MVYLELLIAIVLIFINGILAMSELAVVSARRGRLKAMADGGSRGAAAAMRLADDPGRFLSTVQIGITLVGILAGAFSGATLGARLTTVLAESGLPLRFAEPLAYGGVVALITYLSLIVGELVPKQIALRNAEAVAASVAPAMTMLARVSAPVVWLLDMSGKVILRLLGGRQSSDSSVTADEIKALIVEGESSGAIEPRERGMISGVMRLGDRPARAVMTPRHDLDLIDLSLEPAVLLRTIQSSVHSRLPAWDPAENRIAGIVRKNDLLDAFIRDGTADPRAHVKPASIVLDSLGAFDVLDTLKNSSAHMVLVQDEYGELLGIVTTADILEAIVGAFETEEGPVEPQAQERDDGSWLVEGGMPADELAELLGIAVKPAADFHTAAGMVLAAMRRLPKQGDTVDIGGWRFEVLDMDGRRIDKLLATRVTTVHRAVSA